MVNANAFQVDLVHYDQIAKWQPKVGDIIIWHGWFTHWYGVVGQIQQSGHIVVIRAGLPLLLFTLDQDSMAKKAKTVHMSKIQRSRGGEWTVIQPTGSQTIWFV